MIILNLKPAYLDNFLLYHFAIKKIQLQQIENKF